MTESLTDCANLSRWFLRSGIHVVRVETMAMSAASSVCRLYLRTAAPQSVIAKTGMAPGHSERERWIACNWLATRSIPVPAWRQSGVDADGLGWAIYEDLGLSTVPWTMHRWIGAVKLLAKLHDSSIDNSTHSTAAPELASHSPDVHAVAEEIAQTPDREWVSRWRQQRLTLRWCRQALRLLHSASPWADLLQHRHVLVPCHGDLHPGNVLWSRKLRQLFVIDWEYAHWDLPFFDLFQLLETTSPYSARPRAASRVGVLHAYLDARLSNQGWALQDRACRSTADDKTWTVPAISTTVTGRRWIRDYLRFSFLYLLWIEHKIADDMEVGRYPQLHLQRQATETARRLQGVTRDLWLLS